MEIQQRAKFFVANESALLLTIEEISKCIGVPANTIRSQISRGRYNGLDANIGQKGSRVLFSPSDLVQFAVVSKFSRLGVYFKGKSPIERKFLLSDGSIPEKYDSEDEILGKAIGGVKIHIYDIAGIWPKRDIIAEREHQYLVVYFDPCFTQIINGIQYTPGTIRYEQFENPLDIPPEQQDGLIVVFDFLYIAKQVINALPV
jgi:hypothetical protein